MKTRRCEVGAKWQAIKDAEIKEKISVFVLAIVSGQTLPC